MLAPRLAAMSGSKPTTANSVVPMAKVARKSANSKGDTGVSSRKARERPRRATASPRPGSVPGPEPLCPAPALRRRFDRSADLLHDLADLVLAHDERGGQLDRVARRPDHDPRIKERVVERATDTLARTALNRREIDRAGQADTADVDDVGQPLEPHDGVIPLGLERLGALEQALIAIDIERRQRRGAGERV